VYACVHMRVLYVPAFREFMCVSACLSVCWSVCLSMCLCVCWVCEFDKSRLNESRHLAAPASVLSVCLSSRLSVYLFVCLCLFLSTLFRISICLSLSLSLSVSDSLSLSLSLSHTHTLSLALSLTHTRVRARSPCLPPSIPFSLSLSMWCQHVLFVLCVRRRILLGTPSLSQSWLSEDTLISPDSAGRLVLLLPFAPRAQLTSAGRPHRVLTRCCRATVYYHQRRMRRGPLPRMWKSGTFKNCRSKRTWSGSSAPRRRRLRWYIYKYLCRMIPNTRLFLLLTSELFHQQLPIPEKRTPRMVIGISKRNPAWSKFEFLFK